MSQVITTVAGATWLFQGNGGPALNAPLGTLGGVVTDSSGNAYVSDRDNNMVVKVSPAGILTVFAGNGLCGSSGDGGPATGAALCFPLGLAFDSSGNLFIADTSGHRIRRVSPGG